MKRASWNSTVIALRKLEVVRALAVRDPVNFLAVDDKLARVAFGLVRPMPSRFFVVPGHIHSA
jgi:hypothetical protein